MNTAVVGAGIHGASAAFSLAKRGHQVTVFDQHGIAHKHGSSHGRSRIIRKAYPDPFYSKIMEEAYPMWDQVQQFCGNQFVYSCGLLYVGEASSPTLTEVQQALSSLSIPYEISSERSQRGIAIAHGEIGLFTADGGWVHAEIAIQSLINAAISLGATFVQDAAPDIHSLETRFDGFVAAPGAWIRDFVDIPATIRVQTVAYVENSYHGPVWIEDGPDFLYGFPSSPGESTMKIGVHLGGIDWKPGTERPGIDVRSLNLIREVSRRRFDLDGPQIGEVVTCLYTNLPNEDFQWGRIRKNGYFVSACSGHGFKFGPWIGEQMANFVEGLAEPEIIPRFCA